MAGMKKKLRMLSRVAIFNSLKLNLRSAGKGKVIPFSGTHIVLKRDSAIEVNKNSKLFINHNCIARGVKKSTIRLDEGAALRVMGDFTLYYDADIIIFPGGELTFGSGYINSSCKIRCAESVTIGQDVAISHDVTILDSDFHSICGHPTVSKPVVINDRVWIGTRSTILKGVTVGADSIVAAGSVVTKDVPPHSLVAGVPAKVIKENVWWE